MDHINYNDGKIFDYFVFWHNVNNFSATSGSKFPHQITPTSITYEFIFEFYFIAFDFFFDFRFSTTQSSCNIAIF